MICPACKTTVHDNMTLDTYNNLKQCCLDAMLDDQVQAKFNDPYAHSKAMAEAGTLGYPYPDRDAAW